MLRCSKTTSTFDFCSFLKNVPEIEVFNRQEINFSKFNVL